ncbi:MAG: hypothetical protein U9O49_04270 [Candidatus Thermoplasmatota archaeon]|nr:hypothetical protein [Candidatus Thermoplasmatota archaeon]
MVDNFIKAISSALNLSKIDAKIIKILLSKKSGFLISEIKNCLKHSERNIRIRLDTLIEKGLLERKVEVLKNRRIAYRYSIQPYGEIIEKAKEQLLGHIAELNELSNRSPGIEIKNRCD